MFALSEHACDQWHSSWESTPLIGAIINYAETLKACSAVAECILDRAAALQQNLAPDELLEIISVCVQVALEDADKQTALQTLSCIADAEVPTPVMDAKGNLPGCRSDGVDRAVRKVTQRRAARAASAARAVLTDAAAKAAVGLFPSGAVSIAEVLGACSRPSDTAKFSSSVGCSSDGDGGDGGGIGGDNDTNTNYKLAVRFTKFLHIVDHGILSKESTHTGKTLLPSAVIQSAQCLRLQNTTDADVLCELVLTFPETQLKLTPDFVVEIANKGTVRGFSTEIYTQGCHWFPRLLA
jgi:hypothetical protein